jgi:hypothetical protein
MKTTIPAVEGQTIGLDLGDRRHHACVLDAAGDVVTEEAIAKTRAMRSPKPVIATRRSARRGIAAPSATLGANRGPWRMESRCLGSLRNT